MLAYGVSVKLVTSEKPYKSFLHIYYVPFLTYSAQLRYTVYLEFYLSILVPLSSLSYNFSQPNNPACFKTNYTSESYFTTVTERKTQINHCNVNLAYTML